MSSMLSFDQTTLANMTAALEYVCLKLPVERDNPEIRKHIAEEIVAAADGGRTSLTDFRAVGLKVVNGFLFPIRRPWLRFRRG
jgi:hypothetical protein